MAVGRRSGWPGQPARVEVHDFKDTVLGEVTQTRLAITMRHFAPGTSK
jgi:hypothetical protein